MRSREELENAGIRILQTIRTALYVNLRIMGPALDALGFRMDLSTRTAGTDTESIRFNPNHLFRMYLEDPGSLTREYMQMLIHCLFKHPFMKENFRDSELFDICSDIAAEALIDSIDEKILYRIPSDFRESVYRELREKVQILTAPRIYQYYTENMPGYDTLLKLAAEFRRDDHHFWAELQKDPPENKDGPSRSSREQKWDDRAKDTKEMAAVSGNEASSDKDSLSWLLSFEEDDKTDYREFLRRFMTIREEVRIDPDGFDYGYYNFGIEMFGNMPLIEENEYREEVGIDQLVIAVDTSASTRQEQLQEFLNGTAAILSAQETFFHHVHIHLIECDDQVQNDLLITDVNDLKKYSDGLEIKGGMGTDFRPVFTYVDDLIRRGKLNDLRGLMYFTDGYGTFPENPTPYDTAFVFCKDLDHDDTGVPDWAVKLYV